MYVMMDDSPANDNARSPAPAQQPPHEDPALRRRRIAADEAEREHIFSRGPGTGRRPEPRADVVDRTRPGVRSGPFAVRAQTGMDQTSIARAAWV